MLSVRQRQILKAIIDIYIATAEPVGSRLLSGQVGLNVSPATLRNEMAELIAQGYLEQPHTSAGRVPTHKGYRLYVNELMTGYSLTNRDTDELKHALQMRIAEYDRMMDNVGRVLSELTNYAAVTVTPRLGSGETIRRVEVIHCDGAAYVVVLIMSAGAVRNKLVRLRELIPSDELEAFAAQVNEVLSGTEPAGVTIRHIKRLEAACPPSCLELLSETINFLKEVAEASEELEVNTRGGGNLLIYPEYRDVDRAREIIGFLNGIHTADWLPQAGTGPLVIRIGEENKPTELKDASLIVASCDLGRGCTGYIGIVGPTRMHYSRLAARLQYFAHGLGAVIRDLGADEQDEQKNQTKTNEDK